VAKNKANNSIFHIIKSQKGLHKRLCNPFLVLSFNFGAFVNFVGGDFLSIPEQQKDDKKKASFERKPSFNLLKIGFIQDLRKYLNFDNNFLIQMMA
jgi:hypothetical protein